MSDQPGSQHRVGIDPLQPWLFRLGKVAPVKFLASDMEREGTGEAIMNR